MPGLSGHTRMRNGSDAVNNSLRGVTRDSLETTKDITMAENELFAFFGSIDPPTGV
ncbi:MAG: hypothetical protein ACJ77S_10100 [Gemmatimonadaceae bacterium]